MNEGSLRMNLCRIRNYNINSYVYNVTVHNREVVSRTSEITRLNIYTKWGKLMYLRLSATILRKLITRNLTLTKG
jgi:hypothetical protein